MKVHIVFAHPERRSYGGRLLDTAEATLREAGHEVSVSDLYGMGFNPLAGPADFATRRFSDRLHYDREQKHAIAHDGLAPDIRAELDRVLWCDMLILQFPLWWFSVPAMMKGWIDRVFVNGIAYGAGKKMDQGGLRGRTAMLTLTTGCYPGMAEPDGLVGDMNVNLWPLQHGTLAFTGLRVLPPFVAWSVQYATAETREDYVAQYAARLRSLEQTEPLFFHKLTDYGDDWRLRPGVTGRTVGQWGSTEKMKVD